MSFCCTPMGAPDASSQERYVWRKVCHPIDCPLLTTREAIRLPRMVYAVVAQCPYFRVFVATCSASTPPKPKQFPASLEVFDIPTDPHSANKSTKHFGILPDGSIVAIRSHSFASR
jgi:hypothetical protein